MEQVLLDHRAGAAGPLDDFDDLFVRVLLFSQGSVLNLHYFGLGHHVSSLDDAAIHTGSSRFSQLRI